MKLPLSDAVGIEERPIAIPHFGNTLTGSVGLVGSPAGVVLVANDRGCSRHDPAERALLAGLRRRGFATVLVDLLLPAEAGSPERAAWTNLQTMELARRIASARAFVAHRPELSKLPLVLLGQGAGAAAVVLSAGARPAGIAAVIARGPLPTGPKHAFDSLRAPRFLSSESDPGAGARAASAWLHSRIVAPIAGRAECRAG
jgi:alpha-beta hydrolase superfamily lysophospholipase